MSKRADLREWTTCPCHNQPIKRANLPSHMKRENRHTRRQLFWGMTRKGRWWKTIDRLKSQGHTIDAKKLPNMTDDFSDYPAFEDVIKG